MVQYEHLPVFRDGYELTLRVFQFSVGLPKAHKYSLGEKLRNESINMMQNIVIANSEYAHKRKASIGEALLNLDTVRMLMRLVHDLRACTVKQFAHIAESIESVSRQLAGWHKSTPETAK